MNNQEIFNKAYIGLRNQGFKQSVNLQGACRYRSPDGLKCAVGHLISDGLATAYEGYVPRKNFESFYEPDDTRPIAFNKGLLAELGEDTDLSFLARLQAVHDAANSPEDMVTFLQEFADEFGLTMPE